MTLVGFELFRRVVAVSHADLCAEGYTMADEVASVPLPTTHTKLNRQQITGFWGAWAGWTLDGMDSVIYALVLSPALSELLPKSGYKATPANVGFAGSTLFALFLVGWGLSLVWGPI